MRGFPRSMFAITGSLLVPSPLILNTQYGLFFFSIFDPNGPKKVYQCWPSPLYLPAPMGGSSLVLFPTLVGPSKHSVISKNHIFMYHSPLFELNRLFLTKNKRFFLITSGSFSSEDRMVLG